MLVSFDIDGMVRKQNLQELYDIQFIKCRHLEDDVKYAFESWEDVERMKDSSNMREWFDPTNNFNISLLGSGSYHHFTLFILDQIKKPFYLVMFDWHYDAGWSRWKWQRNKKREMAEKGLVKLRGGGNRFAFGGWVIAASLLKYCKGILLVGMGEGKWEQNSALGPNPKKDWNIDIQHETKDYHMFSDKLKECIPDDCELYVTVCKDVLNKYELKTDWNNGEMTEAELMYMLSTIKTMYGDRICGVDICGEKAKHKWYWDDEEDFIHNNEVRHKLLNRKIIDLFGGEELYGKKTNI
tara:strand:- start:21 stop:908 length:888 start_codon:yes stop_codon:yes gene_type:complete